MTREVLRALGVTRTAFHVDTAREQIASAERELDPLLQTGQLRCAWGRKAPEYAIHQNVGATYVTVPYLTLQMIPAETDCLLTDDNNRGFETFGNSGLHDLFVLSWISR